MKSIDQLLSQLHASDIKLWIEGDRLRYQAPPGSLSPDLRAELIEKKADILAMLRQMYTLEKPVSSRKNNIHIPLSFAQQRLWFLDQLEGEGATAYLISFVLRLIGMLHVPALRGALQEVVNRHEVLRTTFPSVKGEASQVIAPALEVALPVIDLSGLPAEDREQEARRHAQKNSRTGFDLSRGPLIRLGLLKLGAEEHVLLLNMHHIISDGWSLNVLVKEIVTLYAADIESRENPLPPLAIQYADYAVWQRSWLTGDVLQEQIDYWQKQLAGLPPLLTLPADFPRPAAQTFAGRSHNFTLEAELTKRLNALAQGAGATLFMTLAGAFAVLLGRYSRQTDLAMGTPIANRTRKELEGLIGFFVNTLVLRVDLEDNPRFTDLLARMKQTCLDAYAHQDVPFEQLVDELKPERSIVHSPLFQVMFVLQNNPEVDLSLPGLRIQSLATEQTTAIFDLKLSMIEHAGRLYASFEYNTDLFRTETIGRMAEHLRILLEGIVSNPETAVNTLPLMTETERRQVVETFNDTHADYPQDRRVHQLFEAQAGRTPEAPALVCEDRTLTYDQLNRKANPLAHYLRSLGVGPDILVGICMERSLEMVIGLLAILKAGGAYVPMDPNYPQERITFMLEDSKVRILLTQSSQLSVISRQSSAQHPSSSAFSLQSPIFVSPSSSLNIVCLDRDASLWSSYAETNLEPLAGSLNLAYVIYTSGSTGTPKGVAIAHQSTATLIHWANQVFEAESLAGVLASTSICFDLSIFEIFTPLSWGGTAIIVENALQLGGLKAGPAVTLVNTVPSAMRELVRMDGLPESVRVVNLAGEPLSTRLVQEIYKSNTVKQIFDLYGPTEDTTYSTYALRSMEGTPTIGRPIANTQMHILDARMNPAPIGVPGELYIGGAGLARGYLNRPGLTAEKFIPNPFGGEPDARLYKTGDLARWLPDGNIEYLGRNDFQVKIRGFRIELGEIEFALTRHTQIREAIVLAREDSPGDKRLVAYLVPSNGTPPDITDLRTYLKVSLPDYMVPSGFVFLESLPLTPNGKVDRKALPAPEYQASAETYVAPRTSAEETLARIFSEVLGVERVGVHDNFFELGGHSLLAITLLERMSQNGLYADLRALFAAPTLSELAAAVSDKASIVAVPPNLIPARCEAITPEMLPLIHLSQVEIDCIIEGIPGGAVNVQDIYLLAPLQEGILFHHLMSPDGDAYVLSGLFGFDTRPRLENFLEALQKVIDRYDILRTAVVWENLQEPAQVVWRQALLSKEEVELDAQTGGAAEQLYQRFHPRHTRIDVRRAPMLRAYIAHDFGPDRWLLLVLFHQLMGDHAALEVIQQEMQAHLSGQADRLPKPMPLRNFVAQARLGVSQEEHQAFFRQMLGEVEEPTLPFGLLDVQGDGSEIKEARLAVDADLARRIRERARASRVSAASLFHLAWAQVLSRISGREDVVFGTVLFGRMQGSEGADRVMGLFINTLPIRIRIDDESIEASVRRTHALLTDLMRHEHASLALAQRCSGVPAPAPLFSALLNYRHSPGAVQVSPGEAAGAWTGIERLRGEERTNYPFTFSVDDLGKGFGLTAQISASIEPLRVCGYMHTVLERLVGALEKAPGTAVRDLDIMIETEHKQVVEEFNRTRTEYPRDKTVQQLFEEQAMRTPGAAALVFEDQCLTYAELNGKANQLARHLRGIGVGPETLAGICVKRSPEMIIGLLGILKAGGAYVPMDPGYPPERLAFMLEDSQAKVLLAYSNQSPVAGHQSSAPTPSFSAFGLRPSVLKVVCLDTDWETFAAQPSHDPKVEVHPGNLAYVIYTSGSTGMPKGVCVEHGNLTPFLWAMSHTLGLDEEDRLPALTTISFDIAALELYLPLTAGAQIVLATEEDAHDALRLGALLAQHCPTVVQATPATWRMLLAGGWRGNGIPKLLCGGEALSADLGRELAARGKEIWNVYGPTEATVWATLLQITPAAASSPIAGRSTPIGRPLANTQVYILDGNGKPTPIGAAGELYIGGVQVARGYLNRPELTAEKFIPDPFSADPDARLYKTGDLARWLPDGIIECLGRTDLQVKIRGFRIELGEIETTLTRHAQVREALVLAREDSPGDKRLVAYVMPADKDMPPDIAGLRTHLRASLPDYMVPAAFVLLDSMPLTPNGKANRRALPAPEYRAPAETYAAPRNEIEQKMAAIWREVLSVEQVGIHDNFFDLGGHSLLTIRLLERMRQKGMHATLRMLFANPVLADLANAINSQTYKVEVPPNRIPDFRQSANGSSRRKVRI